MIVPVWVSDPDEQISPLTRPQQLLGLLDTGAEVSGISEAQARALRLFVVDENEERLTQRRFHTCVANIAIAFSAESHGQLPDLRTTTVEARVLQLLDEQPFDILVGMDVLTNYRFFMGNGKFRLSAPPTPFTN